ESTSSNRRLWRRQALAAALLRSATLLPGHRGRAVGAARGISARAHQVAHRADEAAAARLSSLPARERGFDRGVQGATARRVRGRARALAAKRAAHVRGGGS